MTITEQINEALINYLNGARRIAAIKAELDETTTDTSGCSCCGSTTISFYIRYKLAEDQKSWLFCEIDDDPIDFLRSIDNYVG